MFCLILTKKGSCSKALLLFAKYFIPLKILLFLCLWNSRYTIAAIKSSQFTCPGNRIHLHITVKWKSPKFCRSDNGNAFIFDNINLIFLTTLINIFSDLF